MQSQTIRSARNNGTYQSRLIRCFSTACVFYACLSEPRLISVSLQICSRNLYRKIVAICWNHDFNFSIAHSMMMTSSLIFSPNAIRWLDIVTRTTDLISRLILSAFPMLRRILMLNVILIMVCLLRRIWVCILCKFVAFVLIQSFVFSDFWSFSVCLQWSVWTFLVARTTSFPLLSSTLEKDDRCWWKCRTTAVRAFVLHHTYACLWPAPDILLAILVCLRCDNMWVLGSFVLQGVGLCWLGSCLRLLAMLVFEMPDGASACFCSVLIPEDANACFRSVLILNALWTLFVTSQCIFKLHAVPRVGPISKGLPHLRPLVVPHLVSDVEEESGTLDSHDLPLPASYTEPLDAAKEAKALDS